MSPIPQDPSLTWIIATVLCALVGVLCWMLKTLITAFREAIDKLTVATMATGAAVSDLRNFIASNCTRATK